MAIDNVAGFGAGFGDKFGIDLQAPIADTSGPTLANQNPAPLDTGVSVSTTIGVDVLDTGSGVDATTVDLYVDGYLAWQSQVQQTGYVVSEQVITHGYRYVITPDIDLPGLSTIDVRVVSEDVLTNASDETYSFDTAAAIAAAPTLQNQSPAPATSDNAPSTNVVLEIVDSSGLDASSVELYINGTIAWQSQAQQSGFVVTALAIPYGFRYTINPDTDFTTPVDVRVVASDTDGTPNTLDTIYSFGILDSVDPVLQNQNPAPSSPGNAQNTTVYLELIDINAGIDESTVVLEVESVVAWSGDAQQNGFAVVKAAITDGFSYTITPPADFDEGVTITVDVDADDLATTPNTLSTSYTFDVLAAAPVLQNQNPAPLDIDVLTDANIYLEIVDPGSGVDASTVVIVVEGDTVWTGDAQQAGYVVVKTPISDGFSYDINPTALMTEAATIDVEVDADDLAPTPNSLSTSYTFDTVSDPPYITNRDPAPLDTGVLKDKEISFDLKDVAGGSGLVLSTVRIYVEGSLAYNGSTDTFLTPYDDVNSLRTPIADGHTFVIDKDVNWVDYATVVVRCVAEDGVGNPVDESWNFQIVDTQGPLVAPTDPTDGEVNVIISTDITVVLSDESSVDTSTILVEIDRGEGAGYEVAFEYDGIPQFKLGWGGPGSSVNDLAGVYTIVIDPTTDLSVATAIKVRVTAQDQYGNPARL